MKAPQRLLDDEMASARLRSDLGNARDYPADPNYDVTAGFDALQKALKEVPTGDGGSGISDTGTPAAAGGTSSGAATSVGRSMLLLMGGGVLVAGIWAFLSSLQDAPGAHAPGTQGSAIMASDAVAVKVDKAAEAQRTNAPVAPVREDEGPSPRASGSGEAPSQERVDDSVSNAKMDDAEAMVRPTGAETSRSSASSADKLGEIDQLQLIRGTLSSDPARAYELAMAGHEEYVGGILYEEREGLAIFALRSLGRTDTAKTRAQAFAVRYPKSALLPKMRDLLVADATPGSALTE